jgi:hypothetical protein
MTSIALYAVDLVATLILVLALYFPRHRRGDLVVALLGINVGVLAVAAALTSSSVGAGLGLGLFGVLSIIRLRSTELSQTEVAYYFAALAFGLLGGLGASAPWVAVGGYIAILLVIALADTRILSGTYRSQLIVVDHAFPNEADLVAYLEQLLGARVRRVSVQRLDLVNDSTTVEVNYQVPRPERLPPRSAPRTFPTPYASPAQPQFERTGVGRRV